MYTAPEALRPRSSPGGHAQPAQRATRRRTTVSPARPSASNGSVAGNGSSGANAAAPRMACTAAEGWRESENSDVLHAPPVRPRTAVCPRRGSTLLSQQPHPWLCVSAAA